MPRNYPSIHFPGSKGKVTAIENNNTRQAYNQPSTSTTTTVTEQVSSSPTPSITNLLGDVVGPADNNKISSLRGISLTTSLPMLGQILQYIGGKLSYVYIPSNLTITDGTDVVNSVNHLALEFGTVGGISPNATYSPFITSSGNVGLMQVGSGLSATSGGIVSVNIATTGSLGIVRVGSGLEITSGGILSAGGTSGLTAVTVTPNISFITDTTTYSGETAAIAETWSNVTSGQVLIGPQTGGQSLPNFRNLVNSDLPQSSVTPGSYTNSNVTFNAQGIATAASNGSGSSPVLPSDYISGCFLSYNTTGSVYVNTGTYYSPSLSGTVTVSSKVTLTPTLLASTLYYVVGSSTGTFTAITGTVTNYQGTAYQDSSGNRYVGSFLTNSSKAVYGFNVTAFGNGLDYRYKANTTAAPFELLNAGTATTATPVSCSSVIPITSRLLYSQVLLNTVNGGGGEGSVGFGTASGTVVGEFTPTGTTGAPVAYTGLGTGLTNEVSQPLTLPLSSSQAFYYCQGSALYFNTSVFTLGYLDQR